jgi:putrescine transport system substrate-binding protein
MIRLLALVFALFTPLGAHGQDLKLYNWADYIGDGNLEAFRTETGITTTTDAYDSTDSMETKLLLGRSGYDWLMTPAPNGARLLSAGALTPIDWSLLPNAVHLDPIVSKMAQSYDPGRRFLVPYAWGTTGIAYNAALVEKATPGQPMDSLSAIFDPDRLKAYQRCGVAMIDEPTEVVPMVLRYLGLDPASESEADLEKVQAHLKKINRFVRHFNTSRIASELAAGDLCVAIAYNGDVTAARKAGDEAKSGTRIDYAVPREGTVMWVDTMAIPAGTPNAVAAAKLINFLLAPKAGAAFSTSTGYATANADARGLVDPALSNDGAVFPGEAAKARLFVVPPTKNAAFLHTRSRIWTRFRAGRS